MLPVINYSVRNSAAKYKWQRAEAPARGKSQITEGNVPPGFKKNRQGLEKSCLVGIGRARCSIRRELGGAIVKQNSFEPTRG